ncbi:MAG: phosphoribosyltransferase family protein [Candidatus Woesebacteria bacterium]
MISKVINGQAYDVLSWQDIGDETFIVGKKIIASEESFDRVIALARGGISIAQNLADLIGVKKISVLQCESYEGIGKTKKPVITQTFTVDITHEKILLVDDLADSGETLLFVKDYLREQKAASVKIATLGVKPWTKIMPDYTAIHSKAWVIFPWETRETITTLEEIWTQKGNSTDLIEENLGKLGYSKDQIETFLTS